MLNNSPLFHLETTQAFCLYMAKRNKKFFVHALNIFRMFTEPAWGR
jgi:hypothetical protein